MSFVPLSRSTTCTGCAVCKVPSITSTSPMTEELGLVSTASEPDASKLPANISSAGDGSHIGIIIPNEPSSQPPENPATESGSPSRRPLTTRNAHTSPAPEILHSESPTSRLPPLLPSHPPHPSNLMNPPSPSPSTTTTPNHSPSGILALELALRHALETYTDLSHQLLLQRTRLRAEHDGEVDDTRVSPIWGCGEENELDRAQMRALAHEGFWGVFDDAEGLAGGRRENGVVVGFEGFGDAKAFGLAEIDGVLDLGYGDGEDGGEEGNERPDADVDNTESVHPHESVSRANSRRGGGGARRRAVSGVSGVSVGSDGSMRWGSEGRESVLDSSRVSGEAAETADIGNEDVYGTRVRQLDGDMRAVFHSWLESVPEGRATEESKGEDDRDGDGESSAGSQKSMIPFPSSDPDTQPSNMSVHEETPRKALARLFRGGSKKPSEE